MGLADARSILLPLAGLLSKIEHRTVLQIGAPGEIPQFAGDDVG